MCFEVDASPPSLPDGGVPISGVDLTLTSADGKAFVAFGAESLAETNIGVVVLPDVRGLFGFYKRLAEQFASAGANTIAIDYFGRTAEDSNREGDFDFWPHVEQTSPDQVQADIAAAVAALRRNNKITHVYTVGFCFGGGNAFMSAAAGHGLAGVIGFYGRPLGGPEWYPKAIEHVDKMEGRVLGLFGGADQSIPQDDVDEFGAALSEGGIEHTLHTYPGAPHSFFDRTYDDFDKECTDAWRRMLAFMRP